MKFVITLVLIFSTLTLQAASRLTDTEFRYLEKKTYYPDMKNASEIRSYIALAKKAIIIDNYNRSHRMKDSNLSGLREMLDFSLSMIESGSIHKISDCQDPALRRLRHLGLPEPQGYFFLRDVKRWRDVPEIIRDNSRSSSGVTCCSRYVLLVKGCSSNRHMVLSHELVHVYTTSIGRHDFPKWFLEGLPTYYSDQRYQPTISKIGNWTSLMTGEYHYYLSYMWYLERLGGKSKLNQFVRESLKSQSLENPLSKYYGLDEETLSAQVSSWNLTRSVFRWLLIGVLIALLCLIISIVDRNQYCYLRSEYDRLSRKIAISILISIIFLLIALCLGQPNNYFVM